MSTPAKEDEVPFSFFVELVHAIAAIKPHRAGEKQPRGVRYADTPAYKTFERWLGALRERYSPLPSGITVIVFRMLFPEEDVRRKYGMQETRLAQHLTKIFGVSSAVYGRGERLRNWKGEDALGCLGNEVETIMASNSTVGASNVTIYRVDALLAELAGTCAFSAEVTSPSESAVVTQIILKDLRPLLYPIPASASHYTSALLEYKSNAVTMLTKEAAMHAWDQSGRMSLIYKTRANLEEAATAYERFARGEGFPQPTVGVPIQIPKCVKGQGTAHSLKVLKGADKIWVETKYDGERAQIHVWLDDDGVPHIRIFSKSGRDSTLDRAGIHHVVYDALRIPHSDAFSEDEEADVHDDPPFRHNIIVEAEMVAYSDVLKRVDEFWRIRSLIATTAIGVRHRSLPPGPSSTQQENMETQCSMISNASDGGTRHLALVFYDVLLVDDVSLLSLSYGERRAVLEQTVKVKPGYAMLAERTCIDAARPDADETLRRTFARIVADHQEGVVIKAEGALYAERRWPWVKLKQDYIPGYGDTVDLVLLGASWEKERARELRVPPTAYTTFYFGALSNVEELKENRTCLPHFQVIFTSSYGLSRAQLEELIFLIKNSDPTPYRHQAATSLPYTLTLCPSLSPPTILLRQPLLAELFGAGFTKSKGNLFYELRFPRIAKIFRPSDRPWIDGTTLPELQQIARAAVGRDRTGKAEDDWARSMFRPDVPPSPGAHCPVKRKRTEDMWVERLAAVDAKVGSRSPTKRVRVDGPPERKTVQAVYRENAENEAGPSAPAPVLNAGGTPKQRSGMLRLDSMTNVVSAPPTSSPRSPSPLAVGRDKDPCTPGPSNRPSTPLSPHSDDVMHHPPPRRLKKLDPPHSINTSRDTSSASQTMPSRGRRGRSARNPALPLPSPPPEFLPMREAQETPTEPTGLTIHQFLQDCVVWLARPHGAPRPAWRAPTQTVIPPGNRVNTLDAVVRACGWTDTPACAWAKRGIVFVDEPETGDDSGWLTESMKELAAFRAAALLADRAASCKPVFLLSMELLAHDALAETATMEEWEGRAICRFG